MLYHPFVTIDYYKIFSDLAARHSQLLTQQKGIEVELAKLTQTLQTIFNMLTPAQQRRARKPIGRIQGPKGGLKEGIQMALKAKSNEWLTPPQIRDYLESIGFDFGGSSTSGLSAIATTLKRMVPKEVEMRTMPSGQIGYRVRGYRGITVGDAVFAALEDLANFPAAVMRVQNKALEKVVEGKIGTPSSIENAFERGLKGNK